jgi:cobaltochelatase CobT
VLVEQLAALFEEEPRAVQRTRGLLAPPPVVTPQTAPKAAKARA